MTQIADEGALTLIALLAYTKETSGEISRVSRNFQRLSHADKQWLSEVTATGRKSLAEDMSHGISVNQTFFQQLVKHRLLLPQLHIQTFPESIAPEELVPYSMRVRHLLMALVREWTADGAGERGILLDTINDLLQKHMSKRPCTVLMPGGSMGRVALELVSKMGECDVTIVERDLLKSLVFKYITESVIDAEISPYILNTCNRRISEIIGKTLTIPDNREIIVNRNSVHFITDDFFQWASEETRKFDVIVTSFFLDACDTSITQLTRIFGLMLDSGGLWVNFGSLLYNYEGESTDSSLIYEASAEEVLMAVSRCGFDLIEQGFKKTSYCANPHSLMYSELDALYFVARKI